MRSSVLAGLVGLATFVVTPAFADPVDWTLSATVERTNYTPIPVAVGDTFTIDMTVDTATPGTPTFFQNGYVYWNVFDAFTLTLNGKTLTLVPDQDSPSAYPAINRMSTQNWTDYQQLAWGTVLTDGTNLYATEANFEFTDLNAFPIGSLPEAPPSLDSARLTNISLYSPSEGGGLIFIAGASVDSWTARSVPEPSTAWLFCGALGLLALTLRGRISARARAGFAAATST